MARVVLIVDADAGFTTRLEAVCKQCGLDVVSATDGESGLMAFTYEHPDIVVLDTSLPDRPGLTLAKQIRSSDGGEVPLILLAPADEAASMVESAAAVSPTALIGKPVDIDALGTALARASDGDNAALVKLDLGGFGGAASRPRITGVEEPLTEPIRLASVPLRGTLGKYPFALVFAALHQRKQTGVLELARERVRKAVFFNEGRPFFARSNAVNELLGNILLKLRKITQEQLDESVGLMKKTKQQQGEILVGMEAITERELAQGLKAQARAKIYNLFGWDRGGFEFHTTTSFPSDIPKLALIPARLLNQGVRQRYKLDRLRPLLAPFLTRTINISPDARQFLKDGKLADEEWAFMSGINGQTMASILANSSKLGEPRAAQILYLLFCCDMLKMSGGEPAAVKPQELVLDEIAATEPSTAGPIDKKRILAEAARIAKLNFFEVFGVGEDASAAEIKSLYFRLAKEWHPDRFTDADPATRKKADDIFSKIGEAHATLTNSKARKEYVDEFIHGLTADASEEANAILNAEHQFLKGERLLDGGNVEKALECFEEALKLYPKEGEFHTFYGWALWQLNKERDKAKADEGERNIREGLKLNPMNGRGHYFLGCIARIGNNTEEAARQFRRCLELQPDNVEAQRELRLLGSREEKKRGGLFSRFKK